MPGKAVFAASPRRIAELLAPLHRVAHELWPVIDGGQTYVCYVNWSDGSFWHFSAMGHYNFPGRESLIRGSPELHEVLDCICASKFDDEVALATLYMSERASFHALLARLELLLDSSPTPRQLRNAAMSVACFGSTAAYKHKDTAGKTMAEIDADHGSVIALAQRAAAVRARAEAALGFKVKAGWARRH